MLPSQSNRIDQNDLTETIQNEATGEEWHGRKQRFQSIIEAHGVLPETLTLKQRLQLYVKEKWTELSCLYLLNACFEKIPFIRCIKEYKVKKYLIGDIIAGITVAVMHIPQGKTANFLLEKQIFSHYTSSISYCFVFRFRYCVWCSGRSISFLRYVV